MALITVEKLVKIYTTGSEEVKALRKISLTIDKGEFTAIAGPSGSGKTTLLNLIGALDEPQSGHIIIGGTDINTLNARRRADFRRTRIGFIFQAYNLIPVLSAAENVEYILMIQGVEKAERRRRALTVLKQVGLSREADRLPRDMSGGQQQRVAVARAMVSRPELILADEPTANLDQKTGASLIDLMHKLNSDLGITFLFSTHDPMVMKRSSRLISLKDGAVADDLKRRR